MDNQVKDIARAMKDINLLSSYELPAEKVLAYAEKLVVLFPKVQPKMIEDLMTDFFLNKVDYIPSKGLRNFTENLEKRNVRGETQEERARRQYLEDYKRNNIF